MDFMYLHWLEGLRTPLLNNLFFGVTALGSGVFYQTVILLLYWCFSKRAGTLLMVAHAVGAIFLFGWKVLAAVPRPYLIDTTLKPLAFERSYSFPSGHSFNAGSVWGGLARVQAKAGRFALAALCFAVVLLVMLSRNYIGVHTPQDVIVGMLLGLGAVAACELLLRWGAQNEVNRSIVYLLLMLGALGFFAFAFVGCAVDDTLDKVTRGAYLSTQKGALTVLGHMLGIVVGLELERRFVSFSTDVSLKYKLLRAVPGLIISAVLYKLPLDFLGAELARFLRMFGYTVFVLAIYPAMWQLWEPQQRMYIRR